MSFGLGAQLSGIDLAIDDQRRRTREDEDREWQKENRQHTRDEREYQRGRRGILDEREDTRFEQSQEDRAHTIERRGITEGRDDTRWEQNQEDRAHRIERRGVTEGREDAEHKRQQELNAMLDEMKRDEYDMYKRFKGARDDMARQELTLERQALEDRILARAFNLAVEGRGADSARLINEMAGTQMKDAADVRIEKTEDGKKVVRVYDADGNVLNERDYSVLDSKYGPKAEKGTYEFKDGHVLDSRTGKTTAVAPGAAMGMSPQEFAKFQRLLTNDAINVLKSQYGGRFEGGMWFPDEGNKEVATSAMAWAEHYIRGQKMEPYAAVRLAIQQAESGRLPPTEWTRVDVNGRSFIDDGAGLRRPDAPESGRESGSGLPRETGATESGAAPSDPEEYFRALREHPQNKGVSDQSIIDEVRKDFPGWTPGARRDSLSDDSGARQFLDSLYGGRS